MGLRNRLVLLIFAITAAAVGFVYLYVVPQLQSSLTAEKLRRLERVGDERLPDLAGSLSARLTESETRSKVRDVAQLTETRVTLLAVREQDGQPTPVFVVADSTGDVSAIQSDYRVADTALADGRQRTGVETIAGEEVGVLALPISTAPGAGGADWIAVLSTPLAEVDDNVSLIQRQILIAGGIALALASAAGFLAAGAVSRRLARLRTAADRVAGGDFERPIPIDSSDEIGQLARSFNDMQRRLERLDAARKEFIANASHELRTPIFSLGGFVELLEHENPSPAEQKQFISEIRGQLDRLQKLTTNLLDLSKLDADAMEMNLAQVDLKQVASQVAGDFRPQARQRRSKLEVRGAGQAQALADPDRTAQILRILIDNALTHTPRGTKVTVTAGGAGGSAELIVSDDGRGIEPRARERVFERFFTGDASGGSGLGLAIAHELAEHMNGEISLVSRRGFTAFTLQLPPAPKAAARPRA